jgi:hypothetical protein
MVEASMDSKVLVWFIHHPNEEEQQVKNEISQGENSEDSDQDENYQYSSDEDPAWHDENGDIDFPIIRTVSIPQFVNLNFSFHPQPLSN